MGSGVPSASPLDRISSRSLAASTSEALGTTTAARSSANVDILPDGASLGDACRETKLQVHIICQIKLSDQSGEEPCRPERTRHKARRDRHRRARPASGAATALVLAQRGYDVAIVYSRSAAEAEESVAACKAAGADAIAVQGDVADDAACRAAVDAAVARFGRVDALVNCAGTTQFVPLSDLDGQSAEDFQKVYAVNVIGPYQMARAAAPHLRARRRSARSSTCRRSAA